MFRNLPPVTKNLLIINVLIWLALSIPAIGHPLMRWCALYYVESPSFNAAQLVTYMFMHEQFAHLFFNMFALLMFGGIIEWTLGSKRFLFYYMCCGIGAAIVQEIVYAIMVSRYHTIFTPDQFNEIVRQGWQLMQHNRIFTDPTLAHLTILVNAPTIGASGAIFGILLAFGMLYPNREMYIVFIPVPVKAKWMVLGYSVLELCLGIGGIDDGVAHFAHLGGMIFGFILLFYWKKRGDFKGWY